jgi:hypothetical protein
MVAIPWYFNSDLWLKCSIKPRTVSVISDCLMLLKDLANVCPKDQFETFKDDPTSWTSLTQSFNSDLHLVWDRIKDSSSFYDSDLIASTFAVKDRDGLWRATLSGQSSDFIDIEFSNSPFHISKFKIFNYEIYDSLIDRLGENLVNSCAVLDQCYSIFKSLGDKCRTQLPAQLQSEHPLPSPIPDWLPIYFIKKCYDIYTKTKNGGRFYMKGPIGEGAFSKIFEIEFVKDEVSYPAVLKLNTMIIKGISPFSAATRDIQGLQLIDEISSTKDPVLISKAQSWLPKFYDVYSPGKEIMIGNEIFASPGMIMEKIETFTVHLDTWNISTMNFCQYYTSYQAIKDLFLAGLIHEDFHMGNIMSIESPPYNVFYFDKKSLQVTMKTFPEGNPNNSFTFFESTDSFIFVCPRMKLVDTGSLNTVKGKYAPHVNIVDLQDTRNNLNIFICHYLAKFNDKYFSGPSYFTQIMNKLAVKISLDVLYDVRAECELASTDSWIFREALNKYNRRP